MIRIPQNIYLIDKKKIIIFIIVNTQINRHEDAYIKTTFYICTFKFFFYKCVIRRSRRRIWRVAIMFEN